MDVTPDHVINAVLDGFREGEATYGVMVSPGCHNHAQIRVTR
jgi:hypothetical protein